MPLEDITEPLNRLIDRVDGLAYSLQMVRENCEALQDKLANNKEYTKPLSNEERELLEEAFWLLQHGYRYIMRGCKPDSGVFIDKANFYGRASVLLRKAKVTNVLCVNPLRDESYTYSLMLESLRHFPNKQINQVWLDAFPDNKPN